ncbi:uncharacterized protein LOC109720909 isoform X2 [Ananas comosus]|uniref:Uncharacterized protein LOC109720909 isoform X2 n=1 Tax=Ananas comosus TaxID=4615 RepID=A0A6P5G7V8_ANACO|nr:uncharacterized protein LOC109720909 isoform X2 [Ananas comosus]
MSPQEELSINRKTVAELLELDISSTQDMRFTCQAKIIEIDTSFGWWYKACYNCKSSIKTYDDTFWCSNCGKNDQSPIPWYKLNTIVGDSTGTTNFTIFGKSAQDLIHIPAQNLATSPGSDKFTLAPTIKTIIGQEHIFQVVPDTQRFKSTVPSFKVLKIFTTNFTAKGKTPVVKKLFAQCEKQLLSPSDDKQIRNELFEETSSALAISSSYPRSIDKQIGNELFEEASSALAIPSICPQSGVDNSEVQPAKRRRKLFLEPTQEDAEDAEKNED